jgi:hypothetical protein
MNERSEGEMVKRERVEEEGKMNQEEGRKEREKGKGERRTGKGEHGKWEWGGERARGRGRGRREDKGEGGGEERLITLNSAETSLTEILAVPLRLIC